MMNVDSSMAFRLVDGQEVRSLTDLAVMMDSLSDDVFAHHVNDSRNDFANWVRDVFNLSELADRMSGKNKSEMQLEMCKYMIQRMCH